MADFEELVEDRLKNLKRDEMVQLWRAIYNAYDSGGPDAVEFLLLNRLDELKRSINKQSKEIKEVIPQKRKVRK